MRARVASSLATYNTRDTSITRIDSVPQLAIGMIVRSKDFARGGVCGERHYSLWQARAFWADAQVQ